MLFPHLVQDVTGRIPAAVPFCLPFRCAAGSCPGLLQRPCLLLRGVPFDQQAGGGLEVGDALEGRAPGPLQEEGGGPRIDAGLYDLPEEPVPFFQGFDEGAGLFFLFRAASALSSAWAARCSASFSARLRDRTWSEAERAAR